MAKILQINTVVNYGSTGRIAEGIGTLILKKGWDSYIAYGRLQRPSASKLISIGSKLDNASHLFQTRLLHNHAFASTNATKKLISQIKSIKPDVIHLHNLHGYYLNIKELFNFLKNYNKPIVYTLHDCWALTGHCTHYDNIGCDKWKTSCNKCPQLHEYPKTWFLDKSKKNHLLKTSLINSLDNLTIVSVSNWLKKEVQKSLISQHKSIVISNGIETNVFKPMDTNDLQQKYNLKNSFVILGVASVWSKNKGLDDFIKLSKSLEQDERIVLIGLSKKQINTLPKEIIGIERTDSIKELAEWYNIANVYVNTSVEESFGMTNSEALACGTPIIVYNATANPEMVISGVGYIVERSNTHDIHEKIKKIKKLGKNNYSTSCINHAKLNYDEHHNFQEYINLYETLIN